MCEPVSVRGAWGSRDAQPCSSHPDQGRLLVSDAGKSSRGAAGGGWELSVGGGGGLSGQGGMGPLGGVRPLWQQGLHTVPWEPGLRTGSQRWPRLRPGQGLHLVSEALKRG